ncbi:hypothetical protein Tco_1489220 [Tanacetum coccineum]
MVRSLLVQDQTVLGKDYSNLLIADSLLKLYGYQCTMFCNKELTIPGQTVPFMAGSLPKTISSMIHISQEVILLKEERTVYAYKKTHTQTLTLFDKESQKIGKTSSSSTTEEYLILEDSVKQGRIVETDDL